MHKLKYAHIQKSYYNYLFANICKYAFVNVFLYISVCVRARACVYVCDSVCISVVSERITEVRI